MKKSNHNSNGQDQHEKAMHDLASMMKNLLKPGAMDEMLKQISQAHDSATSASEKEHDRFLRSTMQSWNNEQRIAFCAALGERWLSTYRTFSEEEGWGDPNALRRSLDAAWVHITGTRLASAQAKRLSDQIIENTPGADDFDAPLALAACEIVDRTLDCCMEKDNLDSAVTVGIAACSYLAMLGQGRDYKGNDPAEEEALWQQETVRQEIERQKALISKIAPITSFDIATIENLNRDQTKF